MQQNLSDPMRKPRMHPLLVAGLIWAVDLFIWTPFILHWAPPLVTDALRQLPQGVQHAMAGSLAVGVLFGTLLTAVGEAFLPLVLYAFLVRPHRLAPLLGGQPPARAAVALPSLAVLAAVALAVAQGAFSGIVSAILLVKFVVVVGPCEEYSYRGVFTRMAKDRFGMIPAALMVSAAFGLSHLWEGHFIVGLSVGSGALWTYLGQTAAFGLAATWLAWRSGSLLWAAVLHGLYDWLGSTNFVPASAVGLLILALVGTEILHYLGRRAHRQPVQHTSAQPL